MSNNRFPKANRLLREEDFARVYKEGRKIIGEYFVFYVLRKKEARARVGIVTPKYIGKAVTRNRIKRLIREEFRKNKGKFKHYDFIVKPKDKVGELTNSVLTEKFLSDFPSQ